VVSAVSRPAKRAPAISSGLDRRTLLAAAGIAALPWRRRAVAEEPRTPASAPKRGGILNFATVDAEPPNYDLHGNVSFAALHPIAPHYSTLLRFDAANYPEIQGDLAQSWSVSADQLSYIFKLHPNVVFHDGTRLTSADVKASYERIVRPPAGVVSARRVNYAAIAAIDTPDPLTVVFHLKWPDASMLANFASEWNAIYSAARLKEDAHFPLAHVMGSGAFTFGEYVKGSHWSGRRFDGYFKPERPYLDGYRTLFIKTPAVVEAYKSGQILAEFRGMAPPQRDALIAAFGDRVTVSESPWLANLSIVFNTRRPPFGDARVRRALSLAIDRWGAAERLQHTTFLKYVGGLMRPGSNLATPEAQLAELPGFGHDIGVSRAAARQLLGAAGAGDLALGLLVRDIPMPHYAGAELLAASWRQVGVSTTPQKLPIADWQQRVDAGDFDVALDFSGDYFDDPTIQLTKYVSHDLSPVNNSGATDRFLDALYIGQAVTTDPQQRAKIVRAFEQHALTEADTVPLLWWNRIVVTAASVRGWSITPSHFIGQDLTDIWLDE
jgi:peptide/nickel transport system substrate-binding protein